MSKPFDYSKWDNIEISDDDEDCHPNIDRESWFRMKHRSRVEREENEDKDKRSIKAEMEVATQRIKILKHELKKLKEKTKTDDDDDDDDDDDLDLDDREGMEAELAELEKQQKLRQDKLDEYEKNKKWNIDNMFEVKEERTVVNPTAGKAGYTSSGFVVPKDEGSKPKASSSSEAKKASATKKTTAASSSSTTPSAAVPAGPKPPPASKPSTTASKPASPPVEVGAMDTYHEFTEKHADLVEKFMAIPDMAGSEKFLLQYGDIMLQENASNYLLLASLEDEMNGYRDKMKLVARQSQIISNIAEMAKTLKQHPGNVIRAFFARMQQREHFEEFMVGVKGFIDKIIKRAVVKKKEMDAARKAEQEAQNGGVRALEDIPREERLGPGGLDPVEVIETLPKEMVDAFESRDVENLREALMKLDPNDAQYHMKRCIDSGLWVANAE